jgi:signal peptidase I
VNPNLLLAILLVVVVRLLGLHSYSIASDAMLPTMRNGDYVMARYYGSSETPQRGDLMAFRNPRSALPGDWVKRVIGLPGDRIQLRSGLVYVNSVVLGRKRVGAEGTRGDIYVETTPEGREYRIMKGETRRARDDTSEIVVPAGHYYVLGDNRDNSADSRDANVGLVAREDVVARMRLVFWGRSRDRLGTWLE